MTNENWQGINIKGGNPTIKDNTLIFESPEENPPNNILFQGSANFVGRELELRIVSERLHKSSVVAISAMSGMGGVGKTELATQYARRYEAEPLLLKVLSLMQRLLGEEHPDVATSYYNLAQLYNNQGKYTQAEPLLLKALRIVEQRLGVAHPNTITIRKNLEWVQDQISKS